MLTRGNSTVSLYAVVVLAFMFCLGAEGQARISGAYLAHDNSGAMMLQLTQTNDGQLAGVFSLVLLKDGKIEASQVSVRGVTDNGQITLTFGEGFLGFGKPTCSGTVRGNTITLQIIDKGKVTPMVLSRASESLFATYTDELKKRATAISTNALLSQFVKAVKQMVPTSDAWISEAQGRVQQYPAIENGYRQIETRMQKLIGRERTIADSSVRYQISTNVYHLDIEGYNFDTQVDSAWDRLSDGGTNLEKQFATLVNNCKGSEISLRQRGASEELIDGWRTACRNGLVQRDRFQSQLKTIREKRASLKAFQKDAEVRRQAVVKLSDKLAE